MGQCGSPLNINVVPRCPAKLADDVIVSVCCVVIEPLDILSTESDLITETLAIPSLMEASVQPGESHPRRILELLSPYHAAFYGSRQPKDR